jgi:hypothetical protein
MPSLGQLLAMWPGSRQFQHSDFVVHSEAMCLYRQEYVRIDKVSFKKEKLGGRATPSIVLQIDWITSLGSDSGLRENTENVKIE